MTKWILPLLLVGSIQASDWEQQAEECVVRMRDPETREALESSKAYVAEAERAEWWTQQIYVELPARLRDSDHPHDQLLLRWLEWAEETRASGLEENPVAASQVDHTRSTTTLDALIRTGSNDPLILAAAVIACPTAGEEVMPDYCGPELDDRFIAADPTNAYPMLQAAQRAWATQDLQRAFEMLARTDQTDRVDWYFGRSQQAAADRLKAHLPQSDRIDNDELAMMAQTLGPQLVGYPAYLALSEICSAESVAGNEDRIHACVSAIDALSQAGATLMDMRVAAALANRMAPALVKTPKEGLKDWAAIQGRRLHNLQNQMAGIGCLTLEQGPDAYQALYGEQYLADVVELGELAAQERVVERFGESRSE